MSDSEDNVKLKISDLASSQKKLAEGKALPLYDKKELQYFKKPLGKAIYKAAIEKKETRGRKPMDKKDKAKWNDRLTCEVCGKQFFRSARTTHQRGRIHQVYLEFDKKIKDLILKN